MRRRSICSCLGVLFVVVAFALCAFAAADWTCSPPENEGGSLDDIILATDTVRALVLWTITDSTTWLDLTGCEILLPASYDLPTYAEQLWDSTYSMSISRFYLDNSNHKHWVSAGTPTAPDGRMFRVNHIYNGHWDQAYIARAIEVADQSLDFADYDHDGDGVVDLLILYYYHIGGTGTYHWSANFVTDDSTMVNGVRVPVRIVNVIPMTVWQGPIGNVFGLTAHEYGHTLTSGGANMIIWDLYGNGFTNGLGGFCVESGGFSNPERTDSRPSVHNPLVRTGKYWIVPNPNPWVPETVISQTHLDMDLTDCVTGQNIYRVNPNPAYPSQYFLITSHHKESPWELYWPTIGVMVWHVDSTASAMVQRGGRKRMDIEDASGLFDWSYTTVADSEFDPGGGCWPHYKYYQRNTGTRQGANPVSGVDSMDVAFVSGWGRPTAPTYGTHGDGSASTFFTQSKRFGPTTNPSSALYSGNKQTRSIEREMPLVAVH